MVEKLTKDAETKMTKSLESLRNEFSRMRTGRAHPSLIEHVSVDYYGNETPLNQVANVNVEDARTLSITPWEKSMVPVIEKAILNANLGLNPVTAGQIIRVPLPPLNQERRQALVRQAKEEAEKARVAIRNARREANASAKELNKGKEISEDELRIAEEKIQQVTNKFISEVDKLLSTKEADLMEV